MANLCSFKMMVKGRKENMQAFYDAMTQKGKIWMGRGADVNINYDDDRAIIDGWCKWSIISALNDNAISMRNTPERWYKLPTDCEFITLFEACERWKLDMEVYSEEPGCEFSEHYLLRDGTLKIDECVDYHWYPFDEYSTKEEAENELGIGITDEEFANCYAERGGFAEWHFDI